MLERLLPGPISIAKSRSGLVAAIARGATIAFVDADLLDRFDGAALRIPVIAILEGKPTEALAGSIKLLDRYPWLAHVIGGGMLATDRAKTHLQVLVERIVDGPEHSMLDNLRVGRVALLARASRREARFERMREFFAKQQLSERTITAIIEVAEELVMNALYDAPVEAGFFTRPRQRNEDVDLPPELACEISYGLENGTAFVRVRDPFGALSRARLVQVLNRCTANAVALDESRGGAGLGLWRVFSLASTISITVTPGSLTEFLVGIRPQKGRVVPKQLEAAHLFFTPQSEYYESLVILPDDDHGLVDQSITLVLCA
ncbi:MAG TPA: hypothetical protein VFQ53_20515 [Kofleriaceae bacterium]|nr:hypothetical protein [Kofleriaceae bacterium]